MAKHRTFWTGAFCGAAVAGVAARLLRRKYGRPQLVAGGKLRDPAKILRIPLKRDTGAGDPAALAPERSHSHSRPEFERSGGAPGGVEAAEVHEAPGRYGERLDHSDPAQPVHSSSRTSVRPPARDTQL
jgi:hypothetical protein